MVTVTGAESPVASRAAPDSVGIVSFVADPLAGVVSVTAGAVVSTLNVLALLVPVCAVLSSWVAWVVYVPSASGDAVVVHEVPVRVTGIVWTTAPFVSEPA